ncbi:HNH endonuclease family protein [Porticoccaceae bacterium]|nr:HNH endonuclease family protein [Porticoccaceae bacterium]
MNTYFIGIVSVLIGMTSASFADGYDRKEFNYRSYKPNTSIGFYTNKACDFINIDHIVSLKDAYDSGASSWGASRKKAFANDRSNHVPSCGRVNSSKGSEGPSDFLRRS